MNHITHYHKPRDVRVINKVYKVMVFSVHHKVNMKIVNVNIDGYKKVLNHTKCEAIPQL